MTTVFLIRHAEADYPGGRIYGFLPVHLNARGRQQAGRLADFCKRQGVTEVVASPLQRTVETAQIIAEKLGVSISTDDRLREWDLGKVWQGMTYGQIVRRYPTSAALVFFHPERVRLAETLSQAGRRVGEAVEEQVRLHPGETIAVISHGDPIGSFWNIALKRPAWMVRRLRVPRASVLRLEFDESGALTKISRVSVGGPPPKQTKVRPSS